MEKIKNKSNSRSLKKSMKTTSINSENNVKRKVNRNKDKNEEKSKRDKYNTYTTQTVLRDLRSSASRSLTNVKTTFDNLSQVSFNFFFNFIQIF
jgi:hypothetical protein